MQKFSSAIQQPKDCQSYYVQKVLRNDCSYYFVYAIANTFCFLRHNAVVYGRAPVWSCQQVLRTVASDDERDVVFQLSSWLNKTSVLCICDVAVLLIIPTEDNVSAARL